MNKYYVVTYSYIVVGYFCAALLASFHAKASGDLNTLRLSVVHAQEPPFHHFHPVEKRYLGIFKELTEQLARRLDARVIYLPTPRSQIEANILSSSSDAVFLSKEWMSKSEGMLFSDEIFLYEEHLYSFMPFVEGEALGDWVKDRTICSRKSYVFPELAPFLQQGILKRLDISVDVPIINVMVKGRCNVALFDEFQKIWLTNNTPDLGKLYRSPSQVSKVSIRLILNKRWLPRFAEINSHIQDMRDSGMVKEILESQSSLKLTDAY